MASEPIYELLVEFSALGTTEQGQFIENMNKFLFASAGQRRYLCQAWKQASGSASARESKVTDD